MTPKNTPQKYSFFWNPAPPPKHTIKSEIQNFEPPKNDPSLCRYENIRVTPPPPPPPLH